MLIWVGPRSACPAYARHSLCRDHQDQRFPSGYAMTHRGAVGGTGGKFHLPLLSSQATVGVEELGSRLAPADDQNPARPQSLLSIPLRIGVSGAAPKDRIELSTPGLESGASANRLLGKGWTLCGYSSRVLRRSTGPPVLPTALSELVGPVLRRLQAADGQHNGRNESGHRGVIAASHVY